MLPRRTMLSSTTAAPVPMRTVQTSFRSSRPSTFNNNGGGGLNNNNNNSNNGSSSSYFYPEASPEIPRPPPTHEFDVQNPDQVNQVVANNKRSQEQFRYEKQMIQMSWLFVLCVFTMTLVLVSGSLQFEYILLLAVTVLTVLFFFLLYTQIALVPLELVWFTATWFFWMYYSLAGFSIEDHASAFQSSILHFFVTLIFYIIPVILYLSQTSDYVPPWQISGLFFLMFFVSIVPFYDNNAFHSLRDSLIRVFGAVLIHSIITYRQYFHTPPLVHAEMRVVIQIMYILYGHFWLACTFFVIHLIFHVVKLGYKFSTVVAKIESRSSSSNNNKSAMRNGNGQQQQQTQIANTQDLNAMERGEPRMQHVHFAGNSQGRPQQQQQQQQQQTQQIFPQSSTRMPLNAQQQQQQKQPPPTLPLRNNILPSTPTRTRQSDVINDQAYPMASSTAIQSSTSTPATRVKQNINQTTMPPLRKPQQQPQSNPDNVVSTLQQQQPIEIVSASPSSSSSSLSTVHQRQNPFHANISNEVVSPLSIQKEEIRKPTVINPFAKVDGSSHFISYNNRSQIIGDKAQEQQQEESNIRTDNELTSSSSLVYQPNLISFPVDSLEITSNSNNQTQNVVDSSSTASPESDPKND